ncbi:MAG: hypothetical protein ACRD5Z_08660 [Bryobacteraceae bacterium]
MSATFMGSNTAGVKPIIAAFADMTREPSNTKFREILGGELYARALHTRSRFIGVFVAPLGQVLIPLAGLDDVASFLHVLIELSSCAPDAISVLDLGLDSNTVGELRDIVGADVLARYEGMGSA